MKFTWFNLMPWPYLPDDFREKNRSVWVDIDQTLFDPEKGHEVYNTYMDQLEYAEHRRLRRHRRATSTTRTATASCRRPNIIAAGLARRTKDAALVVIGNSIALYNPPIRVAEEFAMLDCISGGRLVAGFPVGTSMDTNYCYGQIPALTRDKYTEAHDLIMQGVDDATSRSPSTASTTKLRYVNCWPKPIQKPHPPIYIPGGGSIETWDFCLDNDYNYSYLVLLRLPARARRCWTATGSGSAEREASTSRPYRAGFAQIICVADTDAEAERLYAEHILYFYNRCLHVYPGFADAPGYRTIKTIQTGALSQYAPPRARLLQADLEGPGRRRLRHRRPPGDGAPADGGPDQVAARRQHLLPDAHRQHAGREVQVLDQAVRREGDAEAAQHVPGLRRRRPLLVQADEQARHLRAPAARERDPTGAELAKA